MKVAKAGRYAETKDQLGGILMLKARDLDHAIQLISRDRALDLGAWQIRLAADLNEVMKKSKQLRAETTP